MKNVGNLFLKSIFIVSSGVFCFSLLMVFRAIGGTTQSRQSGSEAVVAQQNIEVPEVTSAESKVLGITDKSKCFNEKEYLKAVAHVRPEIAMYFGTDVEDVTASQLVSCAKTVEVAVEGAVCKEYQLKIETACIEKLLTNTVKFPELVESLRSAENGNIVTARIKDEVVDYTALAVKVSKLYEENSDFATVSGMYATVKPLALQVPTIKNLPNTDGEVAGRYIEFDGSRQLMFLWEKGKYTRFRMSGAFPEYNPVGVFSILNKSPLAWSSTADKWMPYWQAFTYDKKQKAMLGIHALVYWYPGFEKTGSKKIYEPETNIGKPRSTGCLRLTIADAKKVFEWSKVGDMVVVHN